jgi:Outer membrane lipoprotein-sorting protein
MIRYISPRSGGLRARSALYFKLIIGLALLLIPVGGLEAASLSQDQILAGLATRYRGVNGLQATYSRVASTPGNEKIFQSGSSQVATGVLYWSRPDKLLLDQASPQPETLVTDGRTVWWYLPAEKIAYRYRNVNVAGQLKPLMSFLGGLDSLNADFKVSLAPADSGRPGQHGLVLVPKRGAEGGVDRLTIWCDGDFTLTGFRLNAITGETTDFYLTGFRENPKLDNSRFSFKPPRGTEVIEEDGN